MSKTVRLILFLLFVVAFLISAPLVVLYTAGYRLDLGRGRIVHTAVLNISSLPRNANIAIDGQELSDRTPAVIETIVPGEHEVRLTKSGYLPWSQVIAFESRVATFATDVVLFLEGSESPTQTVSAVRSSVSPDLSRLAYVTQSSSWLEVWTTTGSPDSTKLLMRLPSSTLSTQTLSWSLTGKYLLFSQAVGEREELLIARIQDGTAIELPVLAGTIEDHWWDASQDDLLYVFSQSEGVRRISLSGERLETFPLSAARTQSFGDRDLLLTHSNDRSILSFDEDGTASILTYLPLGTYEFVRGPRGLVSLYEEGRHRLILLDPNNREQPIILNEEATLWSWNDAGDQLLTTSGYDLKRFTLHARISETLTRLSTPIDRLAWYPLGAVALFQSNGATNALRLDDPSGPTQLTLIENRHGPFWTDTAGDALYLLNDTNAEDTIFVRQLQ
ncbi:PEGA domain-containing protein [Candidatus Uhrbacteria bacterium]|nr:PEGA domain-containing protein [Candidatus Uhrbacteria bacterium]